MIFFQDYAFSAVSAQRAERFSDGVRDLLIEKSPQSSSDSTSFILSAQFFQLFYAEFGCVVARTFQH